VSTSELEECAGEIVDLAVAVVVAVEVVESGGVRPSDMAALPAAGPLLSPPDLNQSG